MHNVLDVQLAFFTVILHTHWLNHKVVNYQIEKYAAQYKLSSLSNIVRFVLLILIAQDMTIINISIYLIFHIAQLLGNCVLLRGGGSLKIECIVIVELCSKHVE